MNDDVPLPLGVERGIVSNPFEDLPTVPDAEQLVDKAFSRAARTGRAKTGVQAQYAMLDVTSHIVTDNLETVSRQWPDLDAIHPFYRTLADAIVGVDDLKAHLGSVGWAARQVDEIVSEHRSRFRGDPAAAKRQRQQAFARIASVVDEVADDLAALEAARRDLVTIPGIDPTAPTIVVAGYPNVGKSSFLNAVTRASGRIDSYPFTTTRIAIGHLDHRHIRYQIIDTPGLLDRPDTERNAVERQTIAALEHLADCVLVIIDASETCGYPLEEQYALRDELRDRFASAGIPVVTANNKADLETDADADFSMSVTEGTGIDTVLEASIEAIDYEPVLPFESSDADRSRSM